MDGFAKAISAPSAGLVETHLEEFKGHRLGLLAESLTDACLRGIDKSRIVGYGNGQEL